MKEIKKCPNCDKEVTKRSATYCTHKCAMEFRSNEIIKKYNQNPKLCKQCNKIIPYDKRANNFCNSSCSARFNNINSNISHNSRLKRIEKYNLNPKQCKYCNKIIPYDKKTNNFCDSSCGASKHITIKKKDTNKTKYPSSILYNCKCKVCNKTLLLQSPKQFCDDCKEKHTNLRTRYRFKFNVYDYPELFDLKLLEEIGWYAPGGKSGKWNPNGLSRDHKVSVAEAIQNDYDIYYITHVLNCDLIPHSINNSKNTKSSLDYNKLVEIVDTYDKNKLNNKS